MHFGKKTLKPPECDIKIAFLFVVKKNPLFSKIWDDFFSGHEDKFKIYIHPETPETTTWRRESIISENSKNDSGNNVGAYIALFKSAMLEDRNYKFITVSENCLPIKPFMELYAFITENNHSLVKLLNINDSEYDTIITDDVVNAIGKYNLMRHYPGMALSRAHVVKLLSSMTVDVFRYMKAGDEYFLSAINPIRNFDDFAITFDNWQYLNRHINIIQNNIMTSVECTDNMELDFAYLDEMMGLYSNLYNEVLGFKKLTILSKQDLDKMRQTESFFYKEFDEKSDVEKYIDSFI